MSQAVVRLSGVTKSYGYTRALDSVDLTLEEGKFTALLGPNGAGKTTMFQLLSGLFTPDSGHIEVAGHDIASDTIPALANLGIVFQQPTLDLELSVRSNLMYHARLFGLRRINARREIDGLTSRFGLDNVINEPARTLSGGNRRRVEIVRALLHEPKILLLDEPTVGLDPATRQGILDYVKDLATSQNLSVLWATHLVDEAEIADRVVILHRGVIVADGSPKRLIANTGAADLYNAFLFYTEENSGTAPAPRPPSAG